MPRYKRTADEAGLDIPSDPPVAHENVELLHKLRNMWEFASLMQYIYLFGKAVKIDDDFDMEDLEAESLSPQPSERLAEIGLQLLKYVSSHRGLNFEIWDEYVRRQYLAKAPDRNPYGEEEEPAKFQEFDIFTRIRVLHQLSTWTLYNYDRLRSMMPDDEDQTAWRMEPLGWDKDDRAYFVLDDNRLYRRADAPIPKSAPPKPRSKQKSKPAKKQKSAPPPRPRGTRSSKRFQVDEDEEDEEEEELEHEDMEVDSELPGDVPKANGKADDDGDEPAYGFTSKTWELVAITLEEYQEFLSTVFRTRDPNEKILRKRLEEEVMPIIEKRADQLRQKELRKLRELENMQKMAMAKRSSRLAGKAEKEKEERDKREAEEKRLAEIKMAREEEEKQKRIEEGHESRRQTREQRLKDREVKRILHEEELKKLKELEERAESQGPLDDDADNKRISARNAKLQKEQHQRELERLAAEEEEGAWYFDCSKCGMHGENLDDGTHSVACDKCGVWQHSKCLGITPKQAEDEDFVFVCRTCKRKEDEAKRPRIPAIKLGKKASPESAIVFKQENVHGQPRPLEGVYIPRPHEQQSSSQQATANGPVSPPFLETNNHRYPPVSNFARQSRAQQSSPSQGAARTPNGHGYASPPHQQHHQDTHNYAVASAGGHPGYQPPNYYANGHSPQPTAGHYPNAQTPQQPYHQQPPYQYQQRQSAQNWSNMQTNVAQSPVKPSASPVNPAQPYRQSSTAASPRPGSQGQPAQIHQSPKTSLPPPLAHNHHVAPSPQKSPLSTAPHAHQNQHSVQTPRPNLPTQAAARADVASVPPASTGTGNIAADGMSGPWPAGSEAIPKKHDHSPLPPRSSQHAGEKMVMPPVATLAPSPQQHNAGVPGNIPVKKLQEASSPIVSASSPLPAPAVSPLAPRSLGDQPPTHASRQNPES